MKTWQEAERNGTLQSNAWLYDDYKLNPCPKCGGEPKKIKGGWFMAVGCSECDFMGPLHNPYICCHWAWNNLEIRRKL